jgi:chromosome segregation ATPase
MRRRIRAWALARRVLFRVAYYGGRTMEPTDLTIEILKDIRAGIEKTNDRVDSLKGEVTSVREGVTSLREDTNARLDQVSRRIVESEVRTSTAIVDLAGTVREMTTVLRAQADLRPRVERCERDIEELRQRTGVR